MIRVSILSVSLGSLVVGSCAFCVYGIHYEYQPNEREIKMATTLNTKTLYVGEEQGEVLCIKCAGVTLKSAISNAKANQFIFGGMNGERFFVYENDIEGIEDCEYGC